MAAQPPAKFPIAPPVFKVPVIDMRTGCFNQVGINFFQQLWASIQGSGGVAGGSVALAAPVQFSVTGSPVAAGQTGTLTFAWVPVAANLFLAGPTTGGAVAPAFRALVAGDLPVTGVTPGTYGDATHVAQVTVSATGVVTAAADVAITGLLIPPCTVGTLPAPAAGARGFVTDSTVAAVGNFGVAVVGGGANGVPVWADSTTWYIG